MRGLVKTLLAGTVLLTLFAMPAGVASAQTVAAVSSTSPAVSSTASPSSSSHCDVPAGTYVIRSASSYTRVLDVAWSNTSDGGTVQLWSSNTYPCQRFIVTVEDSGYCTITCENSGKVLDIAGGSAVSGTPVWQFHDGGWANQRWAIESNHDGTYTIASSLDNNIVLDNAWGSDADGNAIRVWSRNGCASQKWYFIALPAEVSGTQTVADGVYTVSSASNASYSIDVPDATDDVCRMQMYTAHDQLSQRFQITYCGDGFYTITSIASGMALDASMGNVVPTTAVNQYTYSGGDNQKWAIRLNSDHTYTFIAKTSGMVIDIAGVNPIDGSVLQLWTDGGYTNQKFSLTAASDETALAEGTYSITPRCADGKYLDIDSGSLSEGARCQIFTDTGVDWQKFNISRAEGGVYTIQSLLSGLYLADVDGQVVQMSDTTDASRQWEVTQLPGGLALQNKETGRYLSVEGGCSGDLTRLITSVYRGNASQIFSFVSIAPLISSGLYQMVSAYGERVLDVAGYSSADGANVQLWDNHGTGNQKWYVSRSSDGSYTFENCLSGKFLDVAWSGDTPGTNVWQWSDNGYPCQQWTLEYAGDGWYFIRSLNGLYLDECAGDFNGTNVQIWTGNATSAQKFSFEPTTYEDTVMESSELYAKAASRGYDLSTITYTQLVFVYSDDTSAEVYYCEKDPQGFFQALDVSDGYVGRGGVGTASEEVSVTPEGLFSLPFAFGNNEDPGTALTYHAVTPESIWVDDPDSEYYNTWQEGMDVSGEVLSEATLSYAYAIVIGYNDPGYLGVSRAGCAKGAGSAIFIHVGDGDPTAGCVSVSEDMMIYLLRHISSDTSAGILIL